MIIFATKPKDGEQIAHFISRMYLRHGWRITHDDVQRIKRMVQTGETTFLGRQSLRVSVHRLKWRDKDVVIIYDTRRNQPVTVLGDGMEPVISIPPLPKETLYDDESPEPALE